MRPCNAALVSAVVFTLTAPGAAAASGPAWTQVRPSTSGIPGEEVRLMAFDPQGNLWVGGRWPFWGESGLAMLSADQLPYTPLPGGGFDTGAWRVWSSVDYPIPSPYLADIEFAPSGVIWLASDGGLTRFDRSGPTKRAWRTYKAGNSPLILDAVRSIDMDSQGNLWLTNTDVNSSNGAVFKFDPQSGQWTQYSVGNGLPPGWFLPWKNVNAIMVGADDHVWVTHSVLGGMAEFDGTSWVLHPTPGPLGGMLEDPQGNVWVTTGDAGLYKWDGSGWQRWPTLGGDATITGLGLDRDGVVFVSTWSGNVFKMIGGTTPQFFVAADNIPRSVIGRPDGDIWINNYGGNGTLGTVRHYNSAGTLLERFNSYNSGLPDYFVDRVQRDSRGNLWFASGEGGLSRFDGRRWRNWSNHNDGSEPYPWAGNEPMGGFFIDRQGVGWMGGNGIGRWNVRTGSFTGFWNWQNNPGMGVTLFTAFAQDAAGKLFAAAAYGEIYSFDGSLWVQETLPAGGYTSTFAWLQADSAGKLYAAEPLLLEVWDGVAWSEVPTPTPSFFFDLGGINCMTIGPHDVMWIGTNRGLVRWDGSSFTLFDTANSPLPARQVMGVDVRRDGAIAVSSIEFGSVTPFPNGVAFITGDIGNPDNWTVWSYGSSPLPHYQLGAVKFDARGDLWVSAASEGMVRIRTGTVLGMAGRVP
jgi:ligand-binding sensor domain-containing protein